MSPEKKNNLQVSIIIGSTSDKEVMESCTQYLDFFDIRYEMKVLSAHRNPEELHEYLSQVEQSDVKVLITAAGMAAHLPGVVASQVSVPVIGIPLAGSEMKGMDSLLSIVQMPKGIPVATMAVGKPGAVNAAVYAAKILALSDSQIRDRLNAFRKSGSKL